MFINHFRFVLADQQQQLEDIRDQLVIMANKKVVTTVSCSVCVERSINTRRARTTMSRENTQTFGCQKS